MAKSKGGVSKSKMVWRAIPIQYKLGGGVVLALGTIWLLRKREKPLNLPRVSQTYNIAGTAYTPTPLATEFLQAMTGTNWWGMIGVSTEFEAALEKLYHLDNLRMKAVYSEYNKLAAKNKDMMTLTQRIRDEQASGYGTFKYVVLDKLGAAGLT